jgi:hypothetical protein
VCFGESRGPYGPISLSTSPHLVHIYDKMASERVKEQNRVACRKWRAKNKDKVKELNKKHGVKNNKHTEYRKEYRRRRMQTDPLFKLRSGIRTLIYDSLRRKGHKKNSKTATILGCTFEEFKQYIESQFEPWMNWDNQGNNIVTEPNTTWDLDHIIPISNATTLEEVIKLNHYTNFQPLCSYNNRFIKRNHT